MHEETTKECQKNNSINNTKLKLREHTTFRQFPPLQSENKVAKTKIMSTMAQQISKHYIESLFSTYASGDYRNTIPFNVPIFNFSLMAANSACTQVKCKRKIIIFNEHIL